MPVRFQRFPVARPLFAELFNFEREVDNLFNNFLGTAVGPGIRAYPAIDLAEHENEMVPVAEMPGVRKEDIRISIENGFIILSGTRRAKTLPEGSSWVRNEVGAGEFRRSLELPHEVDGEQVTAELENGILRVVLPKPAQARPREIRIQ